jgi:hypothetical protein
MAEAPKNPGIPPVPMKPGVLKICSNPQCGKPRPNDAYGTLCEDCYCDAPSRGPARSRMPSPRK